MNAAIDQSSASEKDQGPLLLLVDDESAIRAALKRTLRKANYQYIEADNAERAITLLQETSVSCIITDLRMPGVGGHGLVQHCHDQGKGVPIIVISGMADRDDLIDLLRAGVTNFVEKPWSPSELREAVRKAVELAQHQQRRIQDVAAAPADSGSGAAPAQAMSSFDDIVDKLRSGVLEVPAAPKVALQVRQMARNPSTPNRALSAAIEQDPSLAGRLIQVANSALFRGRGRVADLHSAISRVGLDQLVQVIDGIMAHNFYKIENPALGEKVAQIWNHSWARAVAMRLVAQTVGSDMPAESAHLMGLLCDVGVPFLLKITSELGHDPKTDSTWSFIEQQHAAVGAMILAKWLLPQPLVNFVREHHDLDKASHSVLVLRVADFVCEVIGRASPLIMTDGGEQAMLRLHMSRLSFDSVCERAVEYVEANAAPFRAK